MKSEFAKIAIIAIITVAVMAIYTVMPKFDYFSEKEQDSLSVIYVETSDSLEVTTSPSETHTTKPPKKKYVKKIKPVAFSEITGGDDFTNISEFFAKLEAFQQGKIKKLRIAYFGDSITESDLGTNNFRSCWQDSLGGEGVGFVPAVSVLSQFRSSIQHKFSSNWREYSISKVQERKFPLGIFGNVAMPSLPKTDSLGYVKKSVSWHSYSMMDGNQLSKPTLILLNQKEDMPIEYVINNDTLRTIISTSDQLQFITLSDSLIKYLAISYYPQDTCYVYGVDFSDKRGVYVDNFSIRGNKGNNFTHLQLDILEQFNNHFNYDLFILHYGANVTDPIMQDYSWYRIAMKNNIKHLQQLKPAPPILLISMGDRGAMVDTLWVSSPDIPYLIKEQQRIAKDSEVGFFNLFTALGGENSNVKLRTQGLLTPDHTHFTRKGAKYFGDLLYDKFMQEYQTYLKRQ